jgi:hypothetical protein
MSATRKIKRSMAKRHEQQMKEALLKIPKPAVVNGKCECGCRHVPCLGPCPEFIRGANDRCAVCDHGQLCHRRRGEPPPKDWDSPLLISPALVALVPARRLAELRGFKCVYCDRRTMKCRGCGEILPIREVIDIFHVARCPKCGAQDEDCQGKP